MNRNVVKSCLDAIEKAKSLSKLNMFVTDTFSTAIKQAESAQARQRMSIL